MAKDNVKCSSCNVPANVVLENTEPQRIECPECGEFEAYGDFQESVRLQMVAHAAGELGKTFSEMARGNKHITYRPGNLKSHSPKFKLDLSG